MGVSEKMRKERGSLYVSVALSAWCFPVPFGAGPSAADYENSDECFYSQRWKVFRDDVRGDAGDRSSVCEIVE